MLTTQTSMVHGEEGLVMMMDERKFRILQAIIDDYILTTVPVVKNHLEEIRHGLVLRDHPQ